MDSCLRERPFRVQRSVTPIFGPVQPHSVLVGGAHLISSSEVGAGFQASNYPTIMVCGYRTRKTILNERRMSDSICLPPTIKKDGLNSTQSYRMCYPGGSAQLRFAPPLLRVWPLTLMISFTVLQRAVWPSGNPAQFSTECWQQAAQRSRKATTKEATV